MGGHKGVSSGMNSARWRLLNLGAAAALIALVVWWLGGGGVPFAFMVCVVAWVADEKLRLWWRSKALPTPRQYRRIRALRRSRDCRDMGDFLPATALDADYLIAKLKRRPRKKSDESIA